MPPAAVIVLVLWVSSVLGRWVAWASTPRAVGAALVVVAVVLRRRWAVVGVVIILGIGGGAREWSVGQVGAGSCGGVARVLTDPVARGATVSAVLGIGDARLRATAHSSAGARLSRVTAGQMVRVNGTCAPVRESRRARELVSHVRGRMSVAGISEFPTDGGGVWRAANRVRAVFLRGTRTMAPDDSALFAGLVIGDDSRQPARMVDQFRASGLSHLCSVSGQNVAFVMAVFAPFLRRMRPLARLLATLSVIAWFVFLTRAEPSVLRAAAMSALVALNFFRGRTMNGRTVLCVSVSALLVIDPMLAFSVGFMLSAGATAGLAWFSHPLARRLRLPEVVTSTMAAQLGTLPVAAVVFHRVPLVSLVANPLAVPVAGVVMLLGVPFSLLAGLLPDPAAAVLATAMTVPTRYVALVARVCSWLEPGGVVLLLGWLSVALFVGHRFRRHSPVAG